MVRRAVVGVLVTGLVGVAGPVGAATRTVDESDVHETPARLDIRKLTVTNDRPRLKAVITLGKVVRGKTRAYVVLSPVGGAPDAIVGTYIRRGKQKKFLHLEDKTSSTAVLCEGLRVKLKPRRHRVVISLPQRCLGASRGTLRVQALTEDRAGGDIDTTRAIKVRLD